MSERDADDTAYEDAKRLARDPNVRYVTPDGAVAVVGYNDMEEMLTALDARFSQDWSVTRSRATASRCRFGRGSCGSAPSPRRGPLSCG